MKLHSIQHLRAIAALAVVGFHASRSLSDGPPLLDMQAGAYGVDLFFVISGFIMYWTTRRDDVATGGFLARRLIRIAPLYLILTTLLFGIALALPGALRTASADPVAYLCSILFIPHRNPVLHDVTPLLSQGWTLNYEMLFYAVFSVGLLFGRNIRLLLVIGAMTFLASLGLMIPAEGVLLHAYTDPIVLEFCFGMLIAALFSPMDAHWRAPGAIYGGLALLAGCMAVGLTAATHEDLARLTRVALIGVPAALVVGGGLWAEQAGRLPRLPWLFALGEASYSLYLSHGFVVSAMRKVWLRVVPVQALWTDALFTVACMAASAAAGLLLYRLLERPMTAWLLARLAGPAGPSLLRLAPQQG